MARLDGKAAMITGGASGIGEGTARLFIAEGARVVIADIQNERGEALARELGDAAIYERTDVTVEDDVKSAIAATTKAFGRLDVIFNNAGLLGAVGPIEEIPADEFDRTMHVLLRDLTYPDGEVVRQTYSTSDGGLTGVCQWNGTACLNGTIAPYLSNATRTSWGAPLSLPLGNGTTTNYTYDYRLRVSTIINSPRQSLTYAYDEAGNVTSITDAGYSTETLSFTNYDGLNRLVDGSGFAGALTAHYSYNSIGNLLTKQEGASSLTLGYAPTVSGCAAGARTLPHAVASVSGSQSLSLAYDCNGNMVSAGTSTYTFDGESRIKTRSVSSGTATYLYDGSGTEVRRTNADGTWTVYVEGIFEKDNDNAIRKYYHAFGRPVALRKIPASGGAGTVYYPLVDHLGSTATLLNNIGTVLGDVSYWPYGATRSGGMPNTDRRYTGQREEAGDAALGLYNYNARF